MTQHQSASSSWAKRHRRTLTTRHSHEDVLTDREFELLLEACSELPSPRDFQARFICLVAGRLGLRGGEISHLNTEWFDWDRKLLQIPQHEPCFCGYCRRQAAQEASHSEDLTTDEAAAARWHPKTISSARAIPFLACKACKILRINSSSSGLRTIQRLTSTFKLVPPLKTTSTFTLFLGDI